MCLDGRADLISVVQSQLNQSGDSENKCLLELKSCNTKVAELYFSAGSTAVCTVYHESFVVLGTDVALYFSLVVQTNWDTHGCQSFAIPHFHIEVCIVNLIHNALL